MVIRPLSRRVPSRVPPGAKAGTKLPNTERNGAQLAGHSSERIVEENVRGERTPGIDVRGPDGLGYQVKALRRTDPGRNSVATLSRFEDVDELFIVVFEWDLFVRVGIRISSADYNGTGRNSSPART